MVLSAGASGSVMRLIEQEPRDVVGIVLDVGPQDLQAEHLGRPLGRDRGGVRQRLLPDQLGAACRVVGRVHARRQLPQEPFALCQRLRVRIDPLDAFDGRARKRQQMVPDRQLDFADDRQVVLDEQVVIAMNAAANRVLDRQDPVRRPSRRHRPEHVVERLAGNDVGVAAETEGRGFAVGARLSLERDAHGATRIQHKLLKTETT